MEPKYDIDDIVLQTYRGERIPSAREQYTLAQNTRRTLKRDKNILRKENLEYESDDELGESHADIGGNLDEELASGVDMGQEEGGEE
jgi:hypothetical protein